MTTLGRTHSIIRHVRSLRRDRKHRDSEHRFVAEGFHLAEEALVSAAEIELALVSPAVERSDEGRRLRARLRDAGVEIHETSESILESLQDARSPQPLLLVVRRRRPSLGEALDTGSGTPLVAVTHGLQDPGNLGAILRTADAAGATAFVACGRGVDLYHPRAARATMGSIFRLPAAAAETESTLDALAARGIATVAADPRAPDAHDACDLTGPLAVWIGGEGEGLPPRVLEIASCRARIPMQAGVNSLSAPAAAAILLHEAARQRRQR